MEKVFYQLKVMKNEISLKAIILGFSIKKIEQYFENEEIEIKRLEEPFGELGKKDIEVVFINELFEADISHSLVINCSNEQMHSNCDGVISYVLIPKLIKYFLLIKYSCLVNTEYELEISNDSFLRKLKKILINNLDDSSMNMNKLSKMLFMSRSTLSKKIKKATGLKPTEFINNYKIEISKSFLSKTNWQVNRISDNLGFCSQQYYSRLFKKIEGETPLQFRLSRHNNEKNKDNNTSLIGYENITL